jgi:putative flippase GtrA
MNVERQQTPAAVTGGAIGGEALGRVARLSLRLADRYMGGDRAKARELERFLKFSVVGAIGFVVDAGTGAVLLALLKPESGSLLIGVISTLAFIAAIVNNFTWNRYWTYPDSRSKPVVGQLVQFAVVNTVGWGIRVVIIMILQPLLDGLIGGMFAALGEDTLVAMSYFLALVVAVFVVLLWNFFVNRYWTYSDVE